MFFLTDFNSLVVFLTTRCSRYRIIVVALVPMPKKIGMGSSLWEQWMLFSVWQTSPCYYKDGLAHFLMFESYHHQKDYFLYIYIYTSIYRLWTGECKIIDQDRPFNWLYNDNQTLIYHRRVCAATKQFLSFSHERPKIKGRLHLGPFEGIRQLSLGQAALKLSEW